MSSGAVDTVRSLLQELARDEGLTPAKLEHTFILSLMSKPPSWNVSLTAQAVFRLIEELVGNLMDEKIRAAARATMNVAPPSAVSRSMMRRQSDFAARRHVHVDTVRGWWRVGVRTLSASLVDKIGELNSSNGGWDAYRFDTVSGRGEDEPLPDFVLDTVDVAWILSGRVCAEGLTYRKLTATTDGFDRYHAKAWYFNDPRPDSCEIVPLLNCLKGRTTYPGRGMMLTELLFPQPLMRGESIFFAYRTIVHSDRETERIFQHEVRSASVRSLVFRVQFDPPAIPSRVWAFGSRIESAPHVPPDPGSKMYLTPSTLGYVDYSFHDCKHGVKYGIAWDW